MQPATGEERRIMNLAAVAARASRLWRQVGGYQLQLPFACLLFQGLQHDCHMDRFLDLAIIEAIIKSFQIYIKVVQAVRQHLLLLLTICAEWKQHPEAQGKLGSLGKD